MGIARQSLPISGRFGKAGSLRNRCHRGASESREPPKSPGRKGVTPNTLSTLCRQAAAPSRVDGSLLSCWGIVVRAFTTDPSEALRPALRGRYRNLAKSPYQALREGREPPESPPEERGNSRVLFAGWRRRVCGRPVAAELTGDRRSSIRDRSFVRHFGRAKATEVFFVVIRDNCLSRQGGVAAEPLRHVVSGGTCDATRNSSGGSRCFLWFSLPPAPDHRVPTAADRGLFPFLRFCSRSRWCTRSVVRTSELQLPRLCADF